MSQSKLDSLKESVVNIGIGYGVAIAAQVAIFPHYGISISLTQNLEIGLLFTVVSLVRSYAVRRLFNRKAKNAKL
jgi:hypothetical protein